MSALSTIAIVDDELRMQRALQRLLQAEGFAVRTFGSADAFLKRPLSPRIDCVVLDVSMPGLTGLDLQEHLQQSDPCLPIVFLTGHGDIPMSVRAIKAGAINFLTKPVNDLELLTALRTALAESERLRLAQQEAAALRTRLEKLTARELEVLRHVIAGKLNKQIAADLGTSEQTIKVHRMRITEKLGVASVAELVRIAARLDITPVDE
ncbi:MAG TPA: response regulator [Terrimicrobiaceae bacterium]|nr:response regulator [Terrimicrobiaceae bacterium]